MSNIIELRENVKLDLLQLDCNQPFVCPYSERLLSYAIGVQVETQPVTPEEVFKECCYLHYVLADAGSSEDLKNDYSSFFHKRQLSNETVDFELHVYNTNTDVPLVDDTHGQFFDFGSFPTNLDLKGYKVEWKKILALFGEGSYKITKKITVAGVSTDVESLVYTLQQYSDRAANHTVRMDIVMDGYLRKMDIDFTGTKWADSIRVRGFFGNREPQYEEDNLVSRKFEKRQISMKQTNEYKFQTNLVPSCVTDQIWDFFLFANDIYFTDYNLNNHSYNYRKFAAKYEGNDNTDYNPRRRKARLNLLFGDKFVNNNKNNFY